VRNHPKKADLDALAAEIKTGWPPTTLTEA
jgi:hypothetical protein